MFSLSILWQHGNIAPKHMGHCLMPIFQVGKAEAELCVSHTVSFANCEVAFGSNPAPCCCTPPGNMPFLTMRGFSRFAGFKSRISSFQRVFICVSV